MKNKKITIATLVISSLFATAASAENFYSGFSYEALDYSISGNDASVRTISAKIGVKVHDYLGVEGSCGYGVNKGKVSGITIDMQHYCSAFLKPQYSFAENLTAYALIGYTQGRARISNDSNDSLINSSSSSSYGIGLNYRVEENTEVSIGYQDYLDEDGFELTGFSVSLSSWF